MTGKTLAHKSTECWLRALFCIILVFFSGFVEVLLQSVPALASTRIRSVAQASCPPGAKPDTNSILVVLLDRSGSLVAGETTDSNGYSGSATKALADLWPGQIAIIPFGHDQAPVVGPYAHSNSDGIKSIKDYIDNNPPDPNANTPLRPAMDQAKTVFSRDIPACSKLVLITDGVPDAPGSSQQEVNAIESSQEIGWFHDHGLPISVFGLKIDKNTSDGQMADGLLNAIETRTGAGPHYDSVQSAESLASEVTGLYASWRGLSFTAITKDTVNNTYPVSIDPFVDQATIISFYEKGVQNNPITKNGQTIPHNSFESTNDQHYEMDNILDPSHNAGTYSISTVGNADSSVYELVDSNLTLNLLPPPAVVFTGQSLPIQAHFLNSDKGTSVVTGSTSPLSATVTVSLNGLPTQATTVLLYPKQGSDLYTGYYTVPTTSQKPGKTAVEVGTLSIKVEGTATFQGTSAKRGTSPTTIQIDVPKAPPLQPPPPPVCKKGATQCLWERYQALIISITPLLLLLLGLLIAFLILENRPGLAGTITNIPLTRRPEPEDVSTVSLGKRKFFNRLFHKSIIESDELRSLPDARGNLDFDVAKFALVAKSVHKASKKTGQDNTALNGQDSNSYTSNAKEVYIRPLKGNVADIEVRKQGQRLPISVTDDVPLASGDIVRIEKKDNFQYS